MNSVGTFLKRVLSTTIYVGLFGLVLLWFGVILGIFELGRLGIFFRQGAGSGLKVVANMIVIGIAGRCAWVFLRYSLEDLNILKKRDEWIDWRNAPNQDLLDGPALRGAESSKEPDHGTWQPHDWTDRTSLRHRRRRAPGVYWGPNKH